MSVALDVGVLISLGVEDCVEDGVRVADCVGDLVTVGVRESDSEAVCVALGERVGVAVAMLLDVPVEDCVSVSGERV